MKSFYLIFIYLLLREVNLKSIEQIPVDDEHIKIVDSYIIAAFEILSEVQYYLLTSELKAQEQTTLPTSTISTTMFNEPGHHLPETTTVYMLQQSSTENLQLSPEVSTIKFETSNTTASNPSSNHEIPKIGEETLEVNYGTTETNYILPKEINENNTPLTAIICRFSIASSSLEEQEKNEKMNTKNQISAIDSLIRQMFGFEKIGTQSKYLGNKSESKESGKYNLSRFTLHRKRLSWVSRGLFGNFIKHLEGQRLCSTKESLFILYGALFEDLLYLEVPETLPAYSDKIMKDLQHSEYTDIGGQLLKVLERMLERNEITWDDNKAKIIQIINELKNPLSNLSIGLKEFSPILKFPINREYDNQ